MNPTALGVPQHSQHLPAVHCHRMRAGGGCGSLWGHPNPHPALPCLPFFPPHRRIMVLFSFLCFFNQWKHLFHQFTCLGDRSWFLGWNLCLNVGTSFTERFLLFISKSNTNSQGLAQLKVMSSIVSLLGFFNVITKYWINLFPTLDSTTSFLLDETFHTL